MEQREKIKMALYVILSDLKNGYLQMTQTELIGKTSTSMVSSIKEAGYLLIEGTKRASKFKVTYSVVTDEMIIKVDNILTEKNEKSIKRLKEHIKEPKKRLTELEEKLFPKDVFEKILAEQKTTNDLITQLITIWTK